MLILYPFNAVFFALLALHLLLALLVIRKYRHADEATKRRVVHRIYIVVLCIFVLYKLLLPLDAEYMEVYRVNWGGFNYLNELPFNPCNVALLMLSLFTEKMKRPLLSFTFFFALFGPLFSLITPSIGFTGVSLLSIHMIGYYVTHMTIIMAPLLLLGLGLYSPEYRDIPRFFADALLVTVIVFLIDVLLRVTDLNPVANYFYCFDTDGNPILELFHRWLPWPLLQVLPGAVVLVLGTTLVTALVRGGRKLFSAGKRA